MRIDLHAFARACLRFANRARVRIISLLVFCAGVVILLDWLWIGSPLFQDASRTPVAPGVPAYFSHSLPMSSVPLVAQEPPAMVDQQLLKRKLQKARREVARRTRQLDRARNDYVRIRRQLAQSGLSDQYAELARDRIDTASAALAEAKAEMELTQNVSAVETENAAPETRTK